MKKLIIAFALIAAGFTCFAFTGGTSAKAANITVYYSPTCPHCHHALEYINDELVKDYPKITVSEIDVMKNDENLEEFKQVLKKCGFESGGVPTIVIGEKCWQGYSDEIRDEFSKLAIEKFSK